MLFALPCFLAATYMVVRAEEASRVFEARTLEADGDPRDALIAAREAPSAAPNRDTLVTEARALAALGRDRAAVRAYRRALAREPSDWLVRRDLAVVLARAGDREEAGAQMARALNLNPRMSLPVGFASRADLERLRRQQGRAARAAGGATAPPP